MESSTQVLRRMLDERGVEWETDRSGLRVMWGKPVDVFHDTMQCKAVDNALPNGGLNVHICGWTPEQAIAATVGTRDLEQESYRKDAEQGDCVEPGERESYDQLKAKYDELCELTREMWTFTELVNVSGRLSNGGSWSAAEFGKRMKELGVIDRER